MPNVMPLRKVVCQLTNEASAGDDQAIRKAVRAWHNRLASGTIPRAIIRKLGRELFVDVEAFEDWLAQQYSRGSERPGPGRPRSK